MIFYKTSISVVPFVRTTFLSVWAIATCAAPVVAQVTQSFTEPILKSDVAASEAGVVADIRIVEGQTVKSGETLAHLDHDALLQALRIAELRAKSTSEVRKAESTLRVRKQRRETMEAMLKDGHANPNEVDEAVVEHEVSLSDAQLAREKAAEYALEIDRIKAQIKARTIQAPIDGVVSEVHYCLGEFISSGKPQFATVVCLDELLVRFYLLESDVLKLQIDQQVRLRVQVGQAMNDVVGKIRFVSPVTDPDSGTARVDVVIANSDGKLRSGSPCHWVGDVSNTQVGQ